MTRKEIQSNFNYNNEVRKYKSIDDIMGKNRLI